MAISGSKDLIVFPNDNSGRFSIKEVQYTANGTFTVPTGVTAVEVVAVGGGGGGGGGNDAAAGGGGGGGQVVRRNVNVTPGTTYNIQVGAGGHGGQGALISATDNVNTQPGGVGGTTTFGGSSPVNLLMNPSYAKGVTLWEANNIQQLQKSATGASGLPTIIVNPDNTGIQLGMIVTGTGIGASAIVTGISGTTISLSVNNSGTVSVGTTVTFTLQSSRVTTTSLVYNDNIALSASFGATQSNNVIQAQYAQMEDLTLSGGSFFALDTLGNISAAVLSNPYTKLPEMVSPLEISGTTVGANALQCVNSSAGARLVGLTTSGSGALSANGTSGFPYDPNTSYTVSAYVYHTNPTPQNLIMQLRIGDGTNFPGNNQGTSNGTGTVYSAVTPSAGGYHVAQQTVSVPLAGYGGSVSKTISGTSGQTFITVDNADGLFFGQTVSGTGVAVGATITSISGTTVNLSQANAGAVSGTGTFVHSGIFSGAWRRISATFTGLPTYAVGLTAKWAYVGFLIPANTTMHIDNVQVEAATSATAWRPPTYETGLGLRLMSTDTTSENMEVSHDWVKAVPGVQYTGSVYTWAWKEYRTSSAYLEFYDADYNLIGSRTNGSTIFVPVTATKMGSSTQLHSTTGKRLSATATAPGTAAYVRFGVQYNLAANNATGGQEPEFYLAYAQLEVGSAPTFYKDGNTTGYTWAGESHYSTTITTPLVAAKGGGGGGAYNSNFRFWQFGLPGANYGGHAINNSPTAPTYAGGGGGAGSAGGNAISYSAVEGASGTTTGYTSSGSTQLQYHPQNGHLGGYGIATNNVNIPNYGGDGGLGVDVNGAGTLENHYLGGGGGGGGWNTFAQAGFNNPGRGNGGGGKGGHTYLAYLVGTESGSLITDIYSRGFDATPNTGGGGGGAGSNGNNSPLTLATHNASSYITFENNSLENLNRWNPDYNCSISINGTSPAFGTFFLRTVVQDAGNIRVKTSWSDFPILPRTQLYFSGFAFRLGAANTNPGTPNIGTKVARPVVIWLDINKRVIREDRPTVNATLVAGTWTNAAANTAQVWQPPLAPSNAAYFQVAVEGLFMSGGDTLDIDFNTLQYYPYVTSGGAGADGSVIIRYAEKFTA
jgi:hypothetical protein